MHALVSQTPLPRLQIQQGLEKPPSLSVDFAISLVVWPTVNTSVQHHLKATHFYNFTQLAHKKSDKKKQQRLLHFVLFSLWLELKQVHVMGE